MNRSPTFADILALRASRRGVLSGGLAAALAAAAGPGRAQTPTLAATPLRIPARLGFKAVPVSAADAFVVPEGYEAQVLLRWGDPMGMAAGQPAFKPDASNSAAEQRLQSGTHHDGMQFYPLPYGSGSSDHGLLAMNHEYADLATLYADGRKNLDAEKVAKSQAALGVGVVEVRRGADGAWSVVSPSRYARRIHVGTPCAVGGPAAGHRLFRTAADPEGMRPVGTYAGCAHGWTPWGTYLTCEENWQVGFGLNGAKTPTLSPRDGVRATAPYGWDKHDERFDVSKHPNEPHRFGWVVEIDPYEPDSAPVKRTALGRKKQECAAPFVGKDGRIAFYMGDDQAFEYVYKFVTAKPWNPADRAANRTLLDEGTLYVARYDADGTGRWLALKHGAQKLTAADGFADQGEVAIRAREAADAVGATPMDRPEWIAVDQASGEVFCALTAGGDRGPEAKVRTEPANPRATNDHGHILRWREAGDDPAAETFAWDVVALAGDPKADKPDLRGKYVGDVFSNPDGLFVDPRGVLWIATDVSPRRLNRGRFEVFGNNQLLALEPASGEIRRFLTGPVGCEITGPTMTPDGRTLFVNVQHPGEIGRDEGDPDSPRKFSNWPDYDPNGRPRSATVAIRRKDGGVIGA